VALCLNTNHIPSNCNSYWEWAKIHSWGGTLEHAFSMAAICWAIWKARNKTCFEQNISNIQQKFFFRTNSGGVPTYYFIDRKSPKAGPLQWGYKDHLD
jgi:hypothetical protein